MSDLAQLGLRIESQEADAAAARLDKMTGAAERAERATDSLGSGSDKANSAIASLLASIDRTVKEMLALQQAHQGAAAAATAQTGATAALTSEVNQASTSGMLFRATYGTVQTTMGGMAETFKAATREIGQADAHMQAYLAHMSSGTRVIGQMDSHMDLYRANLGKVRTGMGLTTQEGLNLSRQFADIGVTAAMGMNPLMIAIQQGPQLLDIFQTAAIRTGTTVKVVAAQAGAAMWAAVAPLVPVMLAVGAAVGTMAGLWGLATRSVTSDIGNVSAEMGLSEKQLDKLKDKGISTTATAGDAFKALGTTIKEMFLSVFGDELTKVGKWWKEFLDDATRFAVNAVGVIGAAFIGSYNVIRNNWRQLPAVIGDAAISAANLAVRAVEFMVNKGVDGINLLIAGAKGLAAVNPMFSAANAIGSLDRVSMGGLENPFAGAMSGFAQRAAGEYTQAFEQTMAGLSGIYNRWMENTEATARARIRAAAGDAGEAGGGRTAREKAERQTIERPDIDRLRSLNIRPIKLEDPIVQQIRDLKRLQDELRMVDDLARDAGRGLAEAFGEAGRSMGDLLSIMTGYQARLGDIAVAQAQGHLTAGQAARERAAAEVQSYGDALGAAKGFFREGSDGYRVLQAAEAAFRVFQFAMSVQAMAQTAAETSASVAGSAAKGAASAGAGAARMFETLGPYAFPVVAAMLAVLASLGMRGKGGGGGSAPSKVDASVTSAQGFAAQQEQAKASFAGTIAQQVEVRVTADRDGLNAYVAQTAEGVAKPMVIQGMAAAAGATRAQVMSDLDRSRTYSRGGD